MANEAVKVEGPYEVHDFTFATSALIEQGALCEMSGTSLRTAGGTTATTNSDSIFAGIAATEKSNTSKAELGLYTKGVFDLTMETGAETISAGNLVCLSGANTIVNLPNISGALIGSIVGKALETFTSGAGEIHVGEII